YDASEVLADGKNPLRARMLAEIADDESRTALRRAYRAHRDETEGEITRGLLGARAIEIAPMATLFYAWNPGASSDSLRRWLTDRLGPIPQEVVEHMTYEFGKPTFTLLDYAWLLKREPLELWCTGQLVRH